ncbi:MAG: DMT family transporter [Candidatus Limnocylindrales bacterium]
MTVDPVLGMLGLGAFGSGIAFALNYHVIRAAGPSTASTVTYLTPLVAIAVGVAFLGETVVWHEPAGALVVLLGVAISQGRVRAAAGLAARRFRRHEPEVAAE